ncbi:hypothetical protein [uncultured Pseudokineococcus sp.]|uniref:hypothetical protein n=1 Tax=uncultured Pseudokineococcus sp. TaxID=1642928 RepID=UPI00261D5B0D|nr:hypothetical protein [uncultured Pseudokineococcus sp.]
MSRPRCPERLEPVRGWQALWRGAYEVEHAGSTWTVDVDFFDWQERVGLYRDGVRVDERRSRARFALPGGAHLDARLSTFGMRRAHLVVEGREEQMRPLPGTGEAWRADLGRRRPRLARALAALSWVVLAVALVTQVPGWVDGAAGLLGAEPVVGWELPGPADSVLVVAGVLAALERALAMRWNRWLDG